MAEELDPIRQRLIVDTKGALLGVKTLREKLGGLGSFIGRVFKRAAIVGVAALTAALAGAVRQAVVFGKQMAEVSTLIDRNEVSMSRLNRQILTLAQRTPVALTDLTRGLYQVISAGIPAGEAIEFLDTAARAAVGGVTDAKTAVDGLTTAVNAWQKGASSATTVSDKFFTAVKLGKTTFGELSANIGTVAPIAAQAGVSLEEVLSATAALTLAGLDTGTAMTQLRGTLANIIKPSSMAAAEAKRHGIELSAAALKAKGLSGFLEELTSKVGGNTDALTKMFEDVRSLSAVMSLAGNQADDFVRIMVEMGESTGAAAEANRKMNRTVQDQWELIKNKSNVILTELGNTILPVVNEGMESLVGWMERMRDPGEAAASVLERMGANAKRAAAEVSRIAEMQRLNTITDILAQGAPVGGIKGTQGRRFPASLDPFMSFFLSRFSGPTAETNERLPFASQDQITEQMLRNFAEATSLGERIVEITGIAADQNRRLTESEREEITALEDQLDAIVLNNKALENFNDALVEREEILARMPKGPNFLGVEPFSSRELSASGASGTPDPTGGDLIAHQGALDQLRNLRNELELLAAPNEELRRLLEQRQQLQERVNQLNEIAAELGPGAVRKETKAFQELLDVINDTIAARQKDPLLDVGRVAARQARAPTGMDKIAENAKEWRKETEATEKSTLHLRTISFQVANAIQKAVENLDKADDKTGDWKDGLQEALQATQAIARTLRDLGASRELVALVEGAGGIAGGLETVLNAGSLGGQIAGGVAVVGAIGGLISALGTNEEEERRLREALRDAGRAMQDAADAILRSTGPGSDLTLAEHQRTEKLFSELFGLAEIPGRTISQTEEARISEILAELERMGVIGAGTADQFRTGSIFAGAGAGRGIDLMTFLRGAGVTDIAEAFGEPGTRGLSGAQRQAGLAGILGNQQDQFEAFMNQLLTQDMGDALRTQLQGIAGMDLSTTEGQAALRAFIEALVTSLIAGDTRFLGGEMTTDDLDRLAEVLGGFVTDLSAGGDGTSRSVSFNRSVTEIRFNEWIAIAETQLGYVKDMRDMMKNGTALMGGGVNIGPVNVHLPAGTNDPRVQADRIMEHIEFRIQRARKF